MSNDATGDGALTGWYRDRIDSSSTAEEARGYWVFALGLLLGVVGLALFLASESAGTTREAAIAAAAVGLVLLLAGPLIRLPLKRLATTLVYLGGAVSVAAVVWFVIAYPGQWDVQTGRPEIIGLYAAGLAVVALGGVFVPITTARAEEEAALRDEIESLRAELADTAADEDDLAGVVSDLRAALSDALADEADLAAVADHLRGESADATADEADLAARIESMRASQARFEVYEDRGGEYRWRLRHRNGNVIADSGEGYTRRHDAQRGLQSVRRNALGATVLFPEVEADLAPAGEEFEPVVEQESDATFEVYEDAGGDYRWRLRHDNGNVIADGGEGYASRSNAERAIDRVGDYVGPADYLTFDPTGFEVYRDAAAEWRWRLVHRNGNVLADGGEGYSRRHDARRAVDRIQERVDELEFEVYEDAGGEYRWRLRGGNDEILADSGEGYASRSGAEEAAERVESYAPEADTLDIGRAAFELFEDQGGDYRWRLRHRNGNIMADSGQGYSDRPGARDGIERVKRHGPGASVETTEN